MQLGRETGVTMYLFSWEISLLIIIISLIPSKVTINQTHFKRLHDFFCILRQTNTLLMLHRIVLVYKCVITIKYFKRINMNNLFCISIFCCTFVSELRTLEKTLSHRISRDWWCSSIDKSNDYENEIFRNRSFSPFDRKLQWW